MSKPPALKRLSYEDLTGLEPEVRKGIGKLLAVLNPFLSNVTDALNNRLSFLDNMACVIKTIEFTMPVNHVSMTLTGYDTAEWVGNENSLVAQRTGNKVILQGLLQHRATNINTLSIPIFQIPEGYRPQKTFIQAASYNYDQASLYFQATSGNVYMVLSADTSASGHIDVATEYYTPDDTPAYAEPFPLKVDVSSLSSKPIICQAIKLEDLTSKTFKFSTMPELAWTVENDGGSRVVKIHRAEGLTEKHKYRMTVLCAT